MPLTFVEHKFFFSQKKRNLSPLRFLQKYKITGLIVVLATNHRPLTHSASFPFVPNPIYHIVHRAANGSAQGVVHQIRYLERTKVEQQL